MKIFGQHDAGTIAQFEDVRSRAVDAALMADGHVGYVMPIGGVAAYRDKVSVVGVGFDIACLPVGTPVTTLDGHHRPIEEITAAHAVACWDGAALRRVAPCLGAVPRGVRRTVRVRLANGRAIDATGDHRIRTRTGWCEAGTLRPGDAVACPIFVGLPYAPAGGALPLAGLREAAVEPLRRRGWDPVRLDDPRFPALLRLLGCVSGDGHLSRDGKYVSVYTVHAHDARELSADFGRIGFAAATYRRARGPGRRDEYCVRVHSVALHALLAALGSPVGRKRWPAEPMPWLFDLPPWMRAQLLSGFASAEMSTPRVHASGRVPNLALKQAGEDDHAIRFAARLCESLDFEVSVAPSGPAYGGRQVHVLQLLGGRHAQLAFAEQVGFCHARDKRAAAARVAGAVWAHERCVATREHAKAEARARHGAGEPWRRVVDEVSTRFGVEPGFVYHAIYDRRGSARRPPGVVLEPDATAEVCWTPVVDVVEGPEAPVYDVVTGDPAECFVAAGVVVHNCGNAAIRTDLTLADLGETPERVRARLEATADEIQAAVSFGMGRRNRADDAPVDDPLFMDEAWHAVPRAERKDLKHKARQQLGTVGSGNHYVDVFADEAGTLWVGVHFGSRGFGHTVASAFLAMGQGKRWGERAPEREVLLDVTAPLGHDYWHLMNLAGRYAYAGREWVARKVLQLMGAREVELVHNHHNFAWREEHGGEELLVVRKGATPAFPGQRGFVGGSMGDDAVIVEGVTAADDEAAAAQRAALYSTIHGAGRVLSRTAAAGKRNRKTGAIIKPGLVTPEMMHGWLRERGVILRGGGLDEAPQAYRRLPEVLAAQEGTVAVRHVLRPLVVVMAGADEFDPYKD